MQAGDCNGSQPSRGQDLVGFLVRWKHGSPASNGSSFHIVVTARHQNSEDVERYEASVRHEGEEVVARGAAWWAGFRVTNEVVNGIETHYKVYTGLRTLVIFILGGWGWSYRYPHDVALCIRSASDEDAT